MFAILLVGVGGEDVVDGREDLVHALDVANARVELGEEEEDRSEGAVVRILHRNSALLGGGGVARDLQEIERGGRRGRGGRGLSRETSSGAWKKLR